ncbi:hypothetical protein AXG93_1800s1020 [Marchantia polymorpha subsp. ruderalis]|uniref:Uncharacterized protein n=1 Tax=Marchantia polymorpha subsp. ruderalis TaxID=1480154 RepID=A0A176VWM1_MARPO|nr:hypothetical protein AXG93_1800s1020 [Marchantia polymorpha subsp. ruderalis]
MCAFGGTELLRQKRLRGDKRDRQKRQDPLTAVNAFSTVDFGDASTLTDVFKMFAFGAAGQRLRREEFAFSGMPTAERLRRCGIEQSCESARGESLRRRAFGDTPSALREHGHGERRVCEVRFQERDVESNPAADDSAEASADWAARFPAPAVCGEAQFPPVGMELRVPGHGARVAERERPTYARVLTARRAMDHRGLGTGIGKMCGRGRTSHIR